MARTTKRKTEISRAAIYARVSDKSQGRGGTRPPSPSR